MTDTQRKFERLHHLAHPNFNNYEKLPSGKYANKFVQDDWIYFQWVWQAALAHSQWISVSDRLPEKGADILVWCGWVISAMYDGKSTFYTDDGTNPIYQVTHWMPLPQPPITNRKDE